MSDSARRENKRSRKARRHAASVHAARSPRRVGNAWTWIAVGIVAVAVVVAARTLRSRPAASEPGPSARAASPPASAIPASSQFPATVENKNPPPGPAPDGMVWIPGGEFSMGAQDPPDMNDTVGDRKSVV